MVPSVAMGSLSRCIQLLHLDQACEELTHIQPYKFGIKLEGVQLEAIQAARNMIQSSFGEKYVHEKPNR